MTPSQISQIEKSILIRAPRGQVWRALTNLEEFARWFQVKAEGRFAPGARVDMVSTHPLGKGAAFSVVVQSMEPEVLFSWRWHPGSNDDPSSLVEFRLEDAEGGTRVTVVESGFERLPLERRAKAFEDNTRGWEIQSIALQQYAENAV